MRLMDTTTHILVVDDDRDIRTLLADYLESNGYRSLDENQRVEFDITQGPKGPQAEKVRVI